MEVTQEPEHTQFQEVKQETQDSDDCDNELKKKTLKVNKSPVLHFIKGNIPRSLEGWSDTPLPATLGRTAVLPVGGGGGLRNLWSK